MKPLTHLLLSIIPTALLYPIFGINSLIFIIGAVLIDIDHFLGTIFRLKTINPINIYSYYIKINNERKFDAVLDDVYIFHTTEFLIISALLSIENTYFFIFTLGLVYHRILDIFHQIFIIKKIQNNTLILKIFEFVNRT